MGRIISKKEIRFALGYSNRKTFLDHLSKSGKRDLLPPFFWSKNNYFGNEITELESIFGKSF